MTKHAERATTPPEIPGLVQRALAEVQRGRQRPVEIEIPPDTLFAAAEVELLPPAETPERFAGDPESLERAARLLDGAKSPLIWSGGGVLRSGAWDELRRLAARLQAPVVMTSNGKGAVSVRDPLAQNILAGMELLREADVVFAAVPASSTQRRRSGVSAPIRPSSRWILIPKRSREIPRSVSASKPMPKPGWTALNDRLERQGPTRPSRATELEELKRGVAARARAVGPQAEYALAIREALPDDGIFVSEMTQVGYWSNFAFPVYEPLTYITPGLSGHAWIWLPDLAGSEDRASRPAGGFDQWRRRLRVLPERARHDGHARDRGHHHRLH